MRHAQTKEDGYGIIQTMLATLGTSSSSYEMRDIQSIPF